LNALIDTLKMRKDAEHKVGMADGSESPDYHVHGVDKMEARRGSKVNEATDMYGDAATAEEYGYVARG
jgi:yeast amino acid transporter